jgi:Ca2+-binding EF-hand superfamily protein
MASKLLTQDECAALWNRLDYNGNGRLSLAELDKGVVELWPDLNHKPAIMRAYKAADKSEDGFIQKKEFRFVINFIHYYNVLWQLFAEIDTDDDRRLDRDEFVKAFATLGIEEDPDAVFSSMDKNNGGHVLFDEFCSYMAAEVDE